MPERPTVFVLLLGALLVVPVLLNALVGQSLFVWWAPFPVWIVLLWTSGVPLAVVVLIPTALFLFLAFPLKASERGRAVVAVLALTAASAVHVWWMVQFFLDDRAQHMGGLDAYFAVVFALGMTTLLVSWVLWVLGWRRNSSRQFALSSWFMCLWLAWWSVPWFFEPI